MRVPKTLTSLLLFAALIFAAPVFAEETGTPAPQDTQSTQTQGQCPLGDDCPMHGAGQCAMGQDCPMKDACPGAGPMMGGKDMVHHGGPGMMRHGQYKGRYHGKTGHTGSVMYGKIMMAVKGLDLTPAQREKARAIHSDYRKKQIKAMADARVAHIELQELLASDPVKMDKVRAKVDEIARRKSGMMMTGIRSLEELKRLLTPEQKKELRERLYMGAASEPMTDSDGDGQDAE